MPGKILVTYASRTGTTVGVAEFIGNELKENGLQVDILTMAEVKELESYDFVIAGSAIQASKWLPEAMEFIQTNQAALNKKPFAAFLVCMTLSMKKSETYHHFVSDFMEPVRNLVHPVSEGLFAGRLDISKISKVPTSGDRFKFRLSVWFGVWKEKDYRDWEAIKRWTNELADKLKQSDN